MYQTPDDYQEERQRRRLYLIYAISLGIASAICAVLGFFVFTPSTPLIRLGDESRFVNAAQEPVYTPVKQLETSKLIPNRPHLSEDVIFVVRHQGVLRAFLGTDPVDGCFLAWRSDEQVYVNSCGQRTYSFTGRNTDRMATSTSRPIDMVELPVTVQDGVLYVEDRILRRNIQ